MKSGTELIQIIFWGGIKTMEALLMLNVLGVKGEWCQVLKWYRLRIKSRHLA
jgi:hypothetical protein